MSGRDGWVGVWCVVYGVVVVVVVVVAKIRHGSAQSQPPNYTITTRHLHSYITAHKKRTMQIIYSQMSVA